MAWSRVLCEPCLNHVERRAPNSPHRRPRLTSNDARVVASTASPRTYTSWFAWAAWKRYLVNGDRAFIQQVRAGQNGEDAPACTTLRSAHFPPWGAQLWIREVAISPLRTMSKREHRPRRATFILKLALNDARFVSHNTRCSFCRICSRTSRDGPWDNYS